MGPAGQYDALGVRERHPLDVLERHEDVAGPLPSGQTQAHAHRLAVAPVVPAARGQAVDRDRGVAEFAEEGLPAGHRVLQPAAAVKQDHRRERTLALRNDDPIMGSQPIGKLFR